MPLKAVEGPSRLVATKGIQTTMALSTLRTMIAKDYLRRGDGVVTVPDSRRVDRLTKLGRLTLKSAGNKREDREADYDPRSESCVEAFIQLIADLAVAAGQN